MKVDGHRGSDGVTRFLVDIVSRALYGAVSGILVDELMNSAGSWLMQFVGPCLT